MLIKELNEKRCAAAAELEKLIKLPHEERGTEWTEKYDKLSASYDNYRRDLDVALTIEESGKLSNRHLDPKFPLKEMSRLELRSAAVNSWCKAGSKGYETTDNDRELMKAAGLNPSATEIDVQFEKRDLDVATAGKGGTTIPEGFVVKLAQEQKAVGSVRLFAGSLPTSTGNDVPWPVATDIANDAAVLAEGGAIGASVDPDFRDVIFKAFKYSSKPVLVSSELLQDSAFDLGSEIGRMLGARFRRGQNAHFTTGDGTTQPQGFVTAALSFAASAGIVTYNAAFATTVAQNAILDLEHSIDPEYRGANFAFVMHDTFLKEVRKIRDTTGRPIWAAGIQPGAPDQISSKPYFIDQNMDFTDAAGQEVMAAGDWSYFKIRDAGPVRLQRLNELYAGNDKVGFIAFQRVDSRMLAHTAWTRPPIKVLQRI